MEKTKKIILEYEEYEALGSLPEKDRILVESAIEAARRSSYAPYSGFNVGASVLLENGDVVTGSNQENVAYPSGLCAERTALFYATSSRPGIPVVAIAIAAVKDGVVQKSPVTPCGACLQVMSEIESRYGNSLRVIMYGENKTLIVNGVAVLMPFAFAF